MFAEAERDHRALIPSRERAHPQFPSQATVSVLHDARCPNRAEQEIRERHSHDLLSRACPYRELLCPAASSALHHARCSNKTEERIRELRSRSRDGTRSSRRGRRSCHPAADLGSHLPTCVWRWICLARARYAESVGHFVEVDYGRCHSTAAVPSGMADIEASVGCSIKIWMTARCKRQRAVP